MGLNLVFFLIELKRKISKLKKKNNSRKVITIPYVHDNIVKKNRLTTVIEKPSFSFSEDNKRKLEEILETVAKEEKRLLLVGFSLISKKVSFNLNLRYRKKKKLTPVLAFPFEEDQEHKIKICDPTIPKDLGDILICYSLARKQATISKKQLEKVICDWFLHGLLKLLFGNDKNNSSKKIKKKLALEKLI